MESIESLGTFWPVFVPILAAFAAVQIYLTWKSKTPWWLAVLAATLVELLIAIGYVIAPWELPLIPLGRLGLDAEKSLVATAMVVSGAVITFVVWLARD